MSNLDEKINLLITESPILSREDINKNFSVVPNKPGIYAWFFRNIPKQVPLKNCFQRDGWTLLYLGIAPSRINGNSNLRKRIKNNHMNGNISSSTLRFSLAALLRDQIEISFTHSKSKYSIGTGEEKLNEWLNKNALVAYLVDEKPWEYESKMINSLNLPLNIQHNKEHSFYATIKQLRSAARKSANEN